MKIDKIILLAWLIIILSVLSWVSSCSHTADLGDIPEICFERDVLPVFQNNCAISGCHDGTGEPDLILNNYNSISDKVEPGDPNSSEIYKVIIATSGEDKMPPDQPLSLENRIIIRIWIEQGAQPTTCPESLGQIKRSLNPSFGSSHPDNKTDNK